MQQLGKARERPQRIEAWIVEKLGRPMGAVFEGLLQGVEGRILVTDGHVEESEVVGRNVALPGSVFESVEHRLPGFGVSPPRRQVTEGSQAFGAVVEQDPGPLEVMAGGVGFAQGLEHQAEVEMTPGEVGIDP